jgi:hypothetical protein
MNKPLSNSKSNKSQNKPVAVAKVVIIGDICHTITHSRTHESNINAVSVQHHAPHTLLQYRPHQLPLGVDATVDAGVDAGVVLCAHARARVHINAATLLIARSVRGRVRLRVLCCGSFHQSNARCAVCSACCAGVNSLHRRARVRGVLQQCMRRQHQYGRA